MGLFTYIVGLVTSLYSVTISRVVYDLYHLATAELVNFENFRC